MNETATLKTTEISPGQGKCVEVGGKRIAVFNVDGAYYAIDDTCTHAGGPLSDGNLDGTTVTCPWHGAAFDCATGKMLEGPAKADVKAYQVTVQGNEIQIKVN